MPKFQPHFCRDLRSHCAKRRFGDFEETMALLRTYVLALVGAVSLSGCVVYDADNPALYDDPDLARRAVPDPFYNDPFRNDPFFNRSDYVIQYDRYGRPFIVRLYDGAIVGVPAGPGYGGSYGYGRGYDRSGRGDRDRRRKDKDRDDDDRRDRPITGNPGGNPGGQAGGNMNLNPGGDGVAPAPNFDPGPTFNPSPMPDSNPGPSRNNSPDNGPIAFPSPDPSAAPINIAPSGPQNSRGTTITEE
jgi:hypothetical protein